MPLPNDTHWLPGTSALWAGQREGLNQDYQQTDNQRLAALVQELQIKNQYDQQANPLKVQGLDLANQTTQAGIPGVIAKSGQEQLKLNEDQQTSGTRVDATNADNKFKVTSNNIKTVTTMGDQFRKLAMESESVPPVARSAFIAQRMKQGGFDINDPAHSAERAMLQSVSPENLPKAMATIGEHLAQQGEHYLASKYTADSSSASHLAGIDKQGANALAVEQAKIAAGKYQKKQAATDFQGIVQAQLLKASSNVEAQYSILTRAAAVANQNGMPELAVEYQTQADSIERAVKAHIDRGGAPKVDVPALAGVAAAPSVSIRNPAAPGSTPAGQTKSGTKYQIITNGSSLTQ